MELIDIRELLKRYGLLCHTFAYNELPASVQKKLCNTNSNDFHNQYLSLIANAGPLFWSALIANELTDKDPQQHGKNSVTKAVSAEHSNHTEHNDASASQGRVDEFSVSIVQQLLKASGLDKNAKVLYPGHAPAPLIQLGELAQWSTPSPLGLGLHSTYGPWLAYRALVKTTQPLLDTKLQASQAALQSPCLQCELTPCMNACPASAVSIHERFNISRCADYRIEPLSQCKTQCHARNACPVGIEFQYSEEQRAYHMTHALQALVTWAEND